MRTKLLLLPFLLLGNLAYSQVIFRDKEIDADSLAALIPSKEGTAKANALNLLARLICRDHMDSSINLSKRAIRLSESLGYAEGQAEGYCSLGDYYFMMDSLGPTMMNYLNALRLYENLPPSKAYAGLLMQFGEINIRQGRPEFAYKYFMQAKSIFTGLADEESMSYVYFCLGRAKKDVGEWDSSIYFINKAIADVDPANGDYAWDYLVANDVYTFIAGESRDTSFLRLGISMLEIPLSWTSIDDNMRMLLYLNISGDYKQFRTDSHRRIAMNYLEMAGRLADSSTEACEHKDQVLRRMARIHYDMGDYEQALELSMQSLRLTEERLAAYTFNQQNHPLVSLSNKFDHMANKYWVYDCLYQTYSELGDYRQALNYYILTRKTEEEIYQKQQQDLITLMETESKEERTKSRIDLLSRDNELKALAIRQSRTLNLGIAGLFVIVVLIGLLFLRQNKMKNEHKAVMLEQKLLRLQMNPHFIFNALSNILNFIDGKENEKASVYLTTFSKLLRTTLESTREDMVPFEKEVSSLGNYLELQKLRYHEKFEYSIEIDEQIDREDMSIPPMLVQPFIENAIEHGIRHKKTPGRIDVRFLLKGRTIVCEVEDDGVGREKAWEAEVNERDGHKSLATDIIRDRINTLNKKFKQKIRLEIIDKVSEDSGAMGTKVVLDLPYGTVYG